MMDSMNSGDTFMKVFGHFLGDTRTSQDHKDDTRKAVGWTAYAVALLRAIESVGGNGNPRLFGDGPTEQIFEFSNAMVPLLPRLIFSLWKKQLSGGKEKSESTLVVSLAETVVKFLKRHPKIGYTLSFVPVRTIYIDERLEKLVKTSVDVGNTVQVIYLGVGLDSRQFRLQVLNSTSVTSYEIDFDNMLKTRKELFASHITSNRGKIVTCGADLSKPGWGKKLAKRGHLSDEKSIWILEGLVGYLTTVEIKDLFSEMTMLSKPGSAILASWEGAGASDKLLDEHRSVFEDPEQTLLPYGWMTTNIATQNNNDRFFVEGFEDADKREFQFIMSEHIKH